MTPTSRPRITALLFVLLSVGFGLTGYFGWAWYELPRYSEHDIAASTEINLMMDLHRADASTPTGAKIAELRRQVREEIEADIARERREVQTGFAIGLAALLLGLGQTVALRRSRR